MLSKCKYHDYVCFDNGADCFIYKQENRIYKFCTRKKYTAPDNILFLSILSILGAIAEEIFFRGILQNICRPHFGAGLAIIIPAAIFMVFHLAPERMLHTFVGGLLFGYFYYYTGNIYTCIIMHVMTNFMWATFLNSYLLGFISLKTGILAAAGAMTVIGLLMIICLKIIFDRRIGKRQNMCKK